MPFDLFQRGSSYTLTRQDGLTVSLPQALRTKRYVILFIAGQWWAPCRGVAAQLNSFYRSFHDTHDFEVVFLSTDRSEGAMLDFFHSAHGDWLCLGYNDARDLEAALAGEDDLHAKQVPACLIFELDAAAMQAGTVADAANASRDAGVASSTPAGSFARLITKHGREMLARDKDGSLFPWYDDGWADAAAQQRSATVRKVPSTDTPTPTPTPTSPPPPAAVPAAETTVEDSSATKSTPARLVLHTDPRTPPSVGAPSSSAATTPATQPIFKRPPPTVAPAENRGEEEAAATEEEDQAQPEKENAKESIEDDKVSAPAEEGDPTPSTDAAAGWTQDAETSPDARRDAAAAAAPESRRQLTYSKSPASNDRIKRRPPPSRVIVVERRLAASMHTVKVNVADDAGDAEATEKDNAPVEVGLYEALEARISAVMEEVCSSEEGNERDAAVAGGGGGDTDEDALEFSAIEKQVSATNPPE